MSWSPEEFFAAEDAAALEQQTIKPNGAAGPAGDREPPLTPIDPTTLLDVPVPPTR